MISALILAVAAAASSPASVDMNVWYVHGNVARTQAVFEFQQRKESDGHDSSFDESRSYALADPVPTFHGLTLDQLYSGGTHVRFDVRRDAGTIACDGWANNGNASGEFSIALDPQFARELERRGVGSPTAEQQERLVLEDGGYALLDTLEKYGYERPSVSQLIRLTEHGVTIAYLNEMKAAEFAPHSIDEIVRARDHGVSGDFVRTLRAAGINGTLADFVRARDHGVGSEEVRGFADLGYRGLSLDQLVRLRDHGVSVDYVRHMRAQGYSNLSVDDLIRLRDHGV